MRNYVNETGTRANKRQKKRGRVNVLAILISVSMICSLMVPYAQFIEASSDLPNCGVAEHRHDASCYRLDHTPSCGKAEGEDHTHTDACYDKVLACVKEEHTHMDACYSDKNADVEDPAMWDAQFGAAALTKDTWAESLAAVAEKQVGYEESEDNYEVEKDGSHNGYTRYGDFTGDTYGSWDTSFVNFCLEYAGIAEADVFPKEETDAEKWQKEFVKDEKENKTYIADTNKEDYTPQVGDIVFIEGNKENGNDKDETTMGIVTDVDKKKDEITVVEGDSHDQVEENTYDADDKHITDAIQMDKIENDIKAEEAAGSDEQAAADTAQPEGDKGTEAADPRIEDTDNAEADKEEGSDAITTEDPTEPTSVYICGKEEHKHGDACYDEQGELTCKEEEHQHGLDCLRPAEDEEQPAEEPSEEQQPEQTEPQYFCNKEEHRHGDSCLDEKGAIICGKEGHQHDESCLQDPAAETPEQEEPQYFCNKEEHKHTDACYSSKMQEVMEKGNSLFQSMMQTFGAQNQDETPQLSGEKVLICGKEEHQHDESCLQEEEKMVSLETQVDGTTISLSGPESSFEKGKQYTLQAEKIENKEDVAAVEKAIREAAAKEEKTVESYQAFDITLLADGQKVQPLGPVEVTFSGGETAEFASETDDVSILHIDEETGTARDMNASAAADNSLVVEATHFSPYVCVKMAQQADEETAGDGAAKVKVGDGEMVLKLLYGDMKDQAAKPEGDTAYAHLEARGYFELSAPGINGNTGEQDVTVTLHIPKKYIKAAAFDRIPDSIAIAHETACQETDEEYQLIMTLRGYTTTAAVQFGFWMQYWGGIVPTDYELAVTATIECNDQQSTTEPNKYHCKYEEPTIKKYVNTNQYDSMAEDYTKVSASIGEDGKIKGDQYVSFWYKMNYNLWYLREYNEVTLTDILPTYETTDGKTQTAVFDKGANPNWKISEDGKTVTYTATTEKTCVGLPTDAHHWVAAADLRDQIETAELKLRFPDCKIDEKFEIENNDGKMDMFLKKDLENEVKATFSLHEPSEQEPKSVEKTDDLIFTLTTQPTGAGFAKYNSANVITDTKMMRSTPYRWGIQFENTESPMPLKNIIVTDGQQDEDGKKGLDERLKITSLRLDTVVNEKNTNDRKTAQDQIKAVHAIDYDNENTTYYADQFKKETYDGDLRSWYQDLELDSNKEYKEFTIEMKDGYELKIGERIHVEVYTTFRKPDETHYVDNDESRNSYVNKAYVQYKDPVSNDFVWVFSQNAFLLIPARENIWIEKEATYGADNQEAGATNVPWSLKIKGILAAAPGKEYEDMCIIDLLPDACEFSSIGVGEKFIEKVETIENYKNLGNAVIIHLKADELEKALNAVKDKDSQVGEVLITMYTNVLKSASPGRFENKAYLVSKDFLEPSDLHSYEQDHYDLDGDGKRDDSVRMANAFGSVKSPSGVYAEKFIASGEEGESWYKNIPLNFSGGDKFRYKLSIINMAFRSHSGVIVYDVLPRIGDRSINSSGRRGSEYTVKLSRAIQPGEGYKVYYTTSPLVYGETALAMKDALEGENLQWSEEYTDQATAFKIVGDTDTQIDEKGRVDFIIPVQVTETVDEGMMAILDEKASQDRLSGTATYLEATNSFGYKVNTYDNMANIESNYVVSRIPFAGFVIKKVDDEDSTKPLSGAEFKLEKQKQQSGDEGDEWETVKSNVSSDNHGIVSFKTLTEGRYRLTETKAPEGYRISGDPIPVEITLDRTTMEYTITMGDPSTSGTNGEQIIYTGSGTSGDPFVITNKVTYELPSTGGMGIYWYIISGILLMAGAALIVYKNRCREVLKR